MTSSAGPMTLGNMRSLGPRARRRVPAAAEARFVEAWLGKGAVHSSATVLPRPGGRYSNVNAGNGGNRLPFPLERPVISSGTTRFITKDIDDMPAPISIALFTVAEELDPCPGGIRYNILNRTCDLSSANRHVEPTLRAVQRYLKYLILLRASMPPRAAAYLSWAMVSD
jgi:hypothetical protein